MVTRVFTNNTASPITIREIGLYTTQSVPLGYDPYSYGASFLMARDIVDPEVTVAATETLTLTYVLATTI